MNSYLYETIRAFAKHLAETVHTIKNGHARQLMRSFSSAFGDGWRSGVAAAAAARHWRDDAELRRVRHELRKTASARPS